VQTPVPVDPVIGNSQTLVRRYLEAVASGNDAGAMSALGPGADRRLLEQQFLDPTMRGAKVQVEVSTAKGQYFGTYSVDASATQITDHAMIPVGGTTAR
jgi:hypothetical protein